MSALLGSRPLQVWKDSYATWIAIGIVGIAVIAAFYPGLQFMVQNWEQVEEYSYGYLIPVIVAFLIWQKSDQLREHELKGAWSGLFLIVFALLMRLLADLSAIRLFMQYGFVVAMFGISVCAIGWRGTRIIAIPLLVSLFMIPLPQFALRELSQQMQLISSQLGVGLIRLFDISVFLEGNVIDLGSYKLQVVEACSGLRYLFPLMSLGFLAAYFFRDAMWKRVTIFLSTIPLTIIINSLRIGMIGVTVEYWGSDMAEGLLHDFEGWFMFMICIALLVGEMALLARMSAKPKGLNSVFALDFPEPAAKDTPVAYRRLSVPLAACGAFLSLVAVLAFAMPERESLAPARKSLIEFPLQMEGEWQGRLDYLDRNIVEALSVDDYLIANYTRKKTEQATEPWVNFYTAYYASQSGGEATHSPRTCIPGDGWEISELKETAITYQAGTAPLTVNRAVIQKGEQKQLVYYWFKQRDRLLSNEFAVKWYILKDSIQRHRSDGALIRLVTPIMASEPAGQAEERLNAFLQVLQPRLNAYIPD